MVGGVSAEKQQRLLKKKPEIVVGTPGRLWELFMEVRSVYQKSIFILKFKKLRKKDNPVFSNFLL